MASTCYRFDIHDYVLHFINYECACMCAQLMCSGVFSRVREYVFSANLTNFMTLRQCLCKFIFSNELKMLAPAITINSQQQQQQIVSDLRYGRVYANENFASTHITNMQLKLSMPLPLPPYRRRQNYQQCHCFTYLYDYVRG